MGGRAKLLGAGALVGIGWCLALPPPAGADVITPAGACSGSSTSGAKRRLWGAGPLT